MGDPMRTAELFLDPGRLSSLVGADVVARRLRHKPGLSTVATLHTPDGIYGWAQVAGRAHDAKIVRAIRRAERAGQQIQVVEFDGLTLAFGSVVSDPELVSGFAELPPHLTGSAEIVRYNPHRRAVLRATVDGDPVSIRIHSRRGESKEVSHRSRALVADGVATIAPVSRTKYTSTWPWVGETDLLATGGPVRREAARLAGESLSRLHAAGSRATPGTPARHRLLGQAADLVVLDEDLGRRAQQLIVDARLDETDRVPAHRDFSADQVAVGEDRVWLLDLDRYGLAPRRQDLGSFHAVELLSGVEPVTAQLLEGYGRFDLDELRPWVLAGLASRLMEPLREADPDWRARIAERLDVMEQWRR